jgi:TonB family protein
LNFTLYAPPPPPKIMPVAKIAGGGGGGGAHQVVEPTRGRLPKISTVRMLPPQIVRVSNPKLAMEPTMQVNIPSNPTMANLGVQNSPQIAMASQGSGAGSGFGHGMGGGIGASHGTGVGPGTGGGYGGGVMSVGGGVSAPVVIHQVDPEFTEQARQQNYQGTVAIQLIVDAQGNPQDVHVARHLGQGLDEKAVAAVRQYRFRPAMYQGRPVAVQMIVEVDFRLH